MTICEADTIQRIRAIKRCCASSLIFVISVFLFCPISAAQSTFVNEDQQDHSFIDRMYLLDHLKIPTLSIRQQQAEYIFENKPDSGRLLSYDNYDWQFLYKKYPEIAYLNNEELEPQSEKKGFWRNFYKTPHSFLTIRSDDFFLHVKPIVHFTIGDDRNDDDFVFQNTRGISINGIIDKKVYFKTTILENQQRFYNYYEREISRINAIPGQGFYRPYQSGVIDAVRGWDFLNASGYAGIRVTKSIDLRMGHGRHFIGNGMRSLLLSDYANNYFYVQFNTKVWKFHLQNTFSELSVNSSRDNQGNNLLPKKYMANHYLDFQISDDFSIGLFESVIFSRENNFEFQYLNPIILYRSVEQFLDSPDNVLLGLNMSWRFKKGWQLYSQLMLDELKTGEIFSGNGWWGNKVAYQIGIKSVDFLSVPFLDIQLEHNSARPYTYAHRNNDPDRLPITSYSHFNQPLAHPYGANFRETLLRVNYRLSNKWRIESHLLYSKYGEESNGNIGRNILLNYETRENDFGNFTGQGIQNSIKLFQLNLSYEFFPYFYFDGTFMSRSQNGANDFNQKTNYFGIGIRANIDRNNFLL